MGKYVKWGSIILVVLVVLAAGAYFAGRLIKDSDGKDKVSTPVEQGNKTEEDTASVFFQEDKVDEKDLDSKKKVYDMIHVMANTLIIAEDGEVWGQQPITKDRIEAIMKAMEELDITDEKLWSTLKRWEQQDFSEGVEDHNYVWKKYLDGTVGKAIKLKKDKE
ncbi:DUF6241 domain-containing protein [Alloiococcus sp. CFN-8]|uniref:DUF6241 domain-containing protein n=1 Tax=Alloiococcus sp. CFN-8 TaxID=3416081 RepID=UPI003CE6AC0A